ncbi:MAG: hypothetical protein ACRD2A_00840, partial [Vicinamibacterales bacterium]
LKEAHEDIILDDQAIIWRRLHCTEGFFEEIRARVQWGSIECFARITEEAKEVQTALRIDIVLVRQDQIVYATRGYNGTLVGSGCAGLGQELIARGSRRIGM